MFLHKLLRYSHRKAIRSQFNKAISTSARLTSGAYDGDGKTTVDILDSQRYPDLGLIINSFSQVGFRLSNGIYCVGPIVLFSRSVLSWDVGGPFDITPDSLSLFTRLEPKLDVLVLGIGDSLDWRRMIEKQIYVDIIKKSGMNVVIETTEHACATYNFLSMEHRLVAGAFIPPLFINVTDKEVIDTKARYDSLYEMKDDSYPFSEELDMKGAKEIQEKTRIALAAVNKGFYDQAKVKEELGYIDTSREHYEIELPPKSHYEIAAEKEEEEERLRLEAAKEDGFKYVGGGRKGKDTKYLSKEKKDESKKSNEGEKDTEDSKSTK